MNVGSCIVFLVASGFTQCIVFGQAKDLTYRLQGTVNRDTGTVTLVPTGQGFDPNLTNNLQTTIKQGRFLFEGKMAYPISYRIQISPGYISDYFLLQPGRQTITCNADSLREWPRLATPIMAEYNQFRNNYISPVSNQREQAFEQYLAQKSATTDTHLLDSLQTAFSGNRARLIHQQQVGYLSYLTQHPSSYVSLWQLVRDMNDGYQPIFDSLYQALSVSLKNTPTGKLIAQRLHSSRVTAIGQIFPSLTLLDTASKSVSISPNGKFKYTLIDFWFSRCGPCLQQFPQLKNLVATYQAKGFRIVGISIDKSTEIALWKKTIQANGLSWPQYVDPSGTLTAGLLSINYFPSNFLLDEQGTIIRRDISPQDLSAFLSGRME